MTKRQGSSCGSFEQITDRLDEIIGIVKDKNTSLERSLDLFDEAIVLGSQAVDMVDMTNFTAEEKAKLRDRSSRPKRSKKSSGGAGDAQAPETSGTVDGEASRES